MAITVRFDLAYEFEVKAPFAEVFAVLSDVPASAGHFRKWRGWWTWAPAPTAGRWTRSAPDR